MTHPDLRRGLGRRLETLGRRRLLQGAGLGLAALALSRLGRTARSGVDEGLHHRARARRVVHLFQSGGPSQMDTLDPKPVLQERHGEEIPDSVLDGQRLTSMSGFQATLPLAGSPFGDSPHGASGTRICDLLPHTAGIVDRLCILRTLVTEEINHDPAATYLLTGSPLAGRPSMGAWASYGLGSMNRDLPEFCVLVTQGKGGQPLYKRMWGAGFLSAAHQGVQLRAGRDPVLYLTDPAGVDRATRRRMLDALEAMHADEAARTRDAGPLARTQQAELAFRLQASIPDVADLSDEPASTFELYGEDARKPGTFAANCLLARRLLERDVRFVQLFHQGWDQHTHLKREIPQQCRETDQASAALVLDLERRGLLEDTLVVSGGEFGRTAYSQGKLEPDVFGRDHHPRCASMWLAGGGSNAGHVHGETDDFGYNVVRDPVHVHDLNATLLHLLGVDHERLTFRHQGRRHRLTDVHGHVVRALTSG